MGAKSYIALVGNYSPLSAGLPAFSCLLSHRPARDLSLENGVFDITEVQQSAGEWGIHLTYFYHVLDLLFIDKLSQLTREEIRRLNGLSQRFRTNLLLSNKITRLREIALTFLSFFFEQRGKQCTKLSLLLRSVFLGAGSLLWMCGAASHEIRLPP